MKRLILGLICLYLSSSIKAQKATDDFSGKWKTDDDNIIVITKSNNSFTGMLSGTDVKILYNLTFINGKWTGKIYDPRINITANCEATLENNQVKSFFKVLSEIGFYSKEKKFFVSSTIAIG